MVPPHGAHHAESGQRAGGERSLRRPLQPWFPSGSEEVRYGGERGGVFELFILRFLLPII